MAQYALPDLPYDYGSLEPHISGQIIELHHSKHHNAYVTGANTALEKLEAARSANDFTSLVGLEKTLAFNLAGHVLHTLYWQNMTPSGGGQPDGELASAISESFGSFDAMKAQLSQATTLVQGSGWGVLAWDPLGQRLVVQQVEQHQYQLVPSSTALLVIDAWEHAYYLQYKNVRADFVSAFWNVVNWQDVAQRFAAARSVTI